MECDVFQRIIDANQTELLGSIEYLCWSKKYLIALLFF